MDGFLLMLTQMSFGIWARTCRVTLYVVTVEAIGEFLTNDAAILEHRGESRNLFVVIIPIEKNPSCCHFSGFLKV